jgi:phage shock protein PspC (stress-responsive transcriptional regulator)
MEKVFQINLGGLIFFIEEPAYYKLKRYIDQLHSHFAENSEIVLDIESRMAELFSSKIDSMKNTLNEADVIEVIGIMGDIDQMSSDDSKTTTEGNNTLNNNSFRVNKLRRNPYDTKLGGIASGIAAFFNIDPVIIRLLFVATVILYGSGILFYLVLWVVIPLAKGEDAEMMRMQKHNRTRRLFRDSDSRVISGVSAGLANYFNLDVVWIRLAFVVSLFAFGSGFWIYVVLWAITPKAITAADKLMMKGESVDIKSIEREILNNQGPNKMSNFANRGGDVLGTLIKGFAKLVLGFIALILFLVVLAISISVFSVFFGIGNTAWLNELIQFTVQDPTIIWSAKIGLSLVILTPVLGLLVLVIRGVFHVKWSRSIVASTLAGFFFVGFGFLIFAIASFSQEIKVNEVKSSFTPLASSNSDTLILEGIEVPIVDEDLKGWEQNEVTINNQGFVLDNTKKQVYIEIDQLRIKRAGPKDSIGLKVIFKSKGASHDDARQNLSIVDYDLKIEGNKIILPSYFTLDYKGRFRFQELDLVLTLPENKVIKIDEAIKEVIDERNFDEMDGEIYQIQRSEIKCLDCQGHDDELDIEDDYSLEEEDGNKDINFDIKTDNGNKKVRITIDGNSDNKRVKKEIKRVENQSDGTKKLIKEKQIGPIHIREEIDLKKNK